MYIVIFLVSVIISSVSQILLKKSANIVYPSKIKEYLNLSVVLAYGMFFSSSLLTTFAYKGVELGLGPVLEATGYIWVTLLDHFFLGEHIGRKRLMGLGLIIAGVIVFSIKG